MTPTEKQFNDLKEVYKNAARDVQADGSAAIVVPNVQLPAGWTPNITTVRFIVPVGYPASRPDCFWTDQLRLAGGAVPKNTGANEMPGGPAGLLWFSWHVATWSPNHDTLLTYFNVIKKRFDDLQ